MKTHQYLCDIHTSVYRRWVLFKKESSFEQIQHDTQLSSDEIANNLASGDFQAVWRDGMIKYKPSAQGLNDELSRSYSPFNQTL